MGQKLKFEILIKSELFTTNFFFSLKERMETCYFFPSYGIF